VVAEDWYFWSHRRPIATAALQNGYDVFVATRVGVLASDTDPGSPGAIPREKLQEWQSAGSVEWWGHQESVSQMLQKAALVCLPSHGGEGVPKALIEAAPASVQLLPLTCRGAGILSGMEPTGFWCRPKIPRHWPMPLHSY
jgi:hypothetical protein